MKAKKVSNTNTLILSCASCEDLSFGVIIVGWYCYFVVKTSPNWLSCHRCSCFPEIFFCRSLCFVWPSAKNFRRFKENSSKRRKFLTLDEYFAFNVFIFVVGCKFWHTFSSSAKNFRRFKENSSKRRKF